MSSTGALAGFLRILPLLIFLCATLEEAHGYVLTEPDVPFPPARPTAQNLAAICSHGHGRVRYTKRFFSASGSSHFVRRGNAINLMESWYSVCCSGQEALQNEQILCCAQQAWRQVLSKFCAEEYATKTVAYECCEDEGEARWTCFNSELPNPMYVPTPGYTAPKLPQELGFTFNATAC